MTMIPNEFMNTLMKRLQEERKLAQSTTTQYLQSLFKLNNSKPFKNLAFTKKTEDVQKIIDTYAKSTQSNLYMVLTSTLSLFSDKTTYKPTYTHWRDKMMEARKKSDAMPKNEMTEKQEENYLTWEEVNKKKSQLKEEISSFVLNKKLTSAQYEKLQQFLIISLYSDIPPRRVQDFLLLFVNKKLPKTFPTDVNYYDMATQRFIFNVYKTKKTYGEQIFDVPKDLQDTLKMFISHHPLNKGKVKEFKLLVKFDGSPLNTDNSITRILNRIFGKKVGVSMLRHSYITSMHGKGFFAAEQDAKALGHSVKTLQNTYILKEKTDT